MGSKIPARDILLSTALKNYMDSYRFKDYETASEMLYQLNWLLPPDGWISDLPPPSLPDGTYEVQLQSSTHHLNYCKEYGHKIMQSASKFIDDQIAFFDEDN